MAYISETAARLRVPSPLFVVGKALARVKRGYVRRARRHEVENLLGVDDHILADIGVARDDVREALTHRDPSQHLTRTARRRRR